MEHYEKLVRDNIPELLDVKGVPYEKRIADDVEYRSELIKKLKEEADEFFEAGAIEELADVMEVVAALQKLPEYANVEKIREEKKQEKGAFDARIILTGEK